MNIFKKHTPKKEHEETVRKWLSIMEPEAMEHDRKERSRAFLAEYMALRPMRTAQETEGGTSLPSRLRSFIPLRRGRLSPLAAFMAFLVLMTSTTYAAESALPGDPFYAMKLRVNEEVRAVLAFSGEAQADWSIRRAERRLEEAATLAMQGALDEKARLQLQASLKDHVQEAEARASDFSAASSSLSATEVQARLQAVLGAHIGVLGALQVAISEEAGRKEVSSMLAEVSTYVALSPSTPSEAPTVSLLATTAGETGSSEITMMATGRKEQTTTSLSAAEARMAAKKHLEQAQQVMQRAVRRSALTADAAVWAGADTRLIAAQEAYQAGETAYAANDYGKAAERFGAAMRAAIEAEALFSARSHILDILRNNNTSSEERQRSDGKKNQVGPQSSSGGPVSAGAAATVDANAAVSAGGDTPTSSGSATVEATIDLNTGTSFQQEQPGQQEGKAEVRDAVIRALRGLTL